MRVCQRLAVGLRHARPAAGGDLDETVALEALERLPHRCARHPETAGQFGVAQALAGPQAPVEDGLAEHAVDLVAEDGAARIEGREVRFAGHGCDQCMSAHLRDP